MGRRRFAVGLRSGAWLGGTTVGIAHCAAHVAATNPCVAAPIPQGDFLWGGGGAPKEAPLGGAPKDGRGKSRLWKVADRVSLLLRWRPGERSRRIEHRRRAHVGRHAVIVRRIVRWISMVNRFISTSGQQGSKSGGHGRPRQSFHAATLEESRIASLNEKRDALLSKLRARMRHAPLDERCRLTTGHSDLIWKSRPHGVLLKEELPWTLNRSPAW
jgi:hypothetical protein